MAKCYVCQVDITPANESNEHIILSACGGRLKSKELLCKEHNSNFGNSFDAELARQTNDIANLLSIKRQSGEPPAIKGKLQSTDEDYYLQNDGKPVMGKPIINVDFDGQKLNLSIKARNKKEMREILKGLKKKKYPDLDVEQALMSAEYCKKYFDEPIYFQTSIGGKEVFKSISKSAINFFIMKGGDRKHVTHLFPYLEDEIILDITRIHLPDEIIYMPKENEVSHIIRLIGNPEEKILYVYIELFNVHNFIVNLNDTYDGAALDETYVFDVIKTKELNESIPLNYTREQLLSLYREELYNEEDYTVYQEIIFQKVKIQYERVLSIAMERQLSRYIDELINRALKNSLLKYHEGVLITKAMLDEFNNELMKEINLLIYYNSRQREAQNKE